jgi:hypothetical protein
LDVRLNLQTMEILTKEETSKTLVIFDSTDKIEPSIDEGGMTTPEGQIRSPIREKSMKNFMDM